MKIQDVLKVKGHEVHSVAAAEPLARTLARFADSKIRCLPVTEGAALVGILTLRDVVAFIDRYGAEALGRNVGDAMTRDVVRIAPSAPLEEAQQLFAERGFNHLPVEDETGKLVGLVTPSDVLRRHLEDVQEGAAYLRDYIAGVYS